MPAGATIGNCNGRKCDMSIHATIPLGNERNAQCVAGTQCFDDELLCVNADGQSLECSGCDFGDGADIDFCLTPAIVAGMKNGAREI